MFAFSGHLTVLGEVVPCFSRTTGTNRIAPNKKRPVKGRLPVLALSEPATTVIDWHSVEARGRALLAEGTACARAGSVKYHMEEGAKRGRAAGCEGRPGQGSDCCPKQDARLAWELHPVSRWLGGSKKWGIVEEVGRVSCGPGFLGGYGHMGRRQGPNSGGRSGW